MRLSAISIGLLVGTASAVGIDVVLEDIGEPLEGPAPVRTEVGQPMQPPILTEVGQPMQPPPVLTEVGQPMQPPVAEADIIPPPPALDQPEGPLTHIRMRPCDDETKITSKLVIWAPGECQRDFEDPTESFRMQCTKDGSLWVRAYDDAFCESIPRANLFVRHGEFALPPASLAPFSTPDECVQFSLPPSIRKACELKQPTASPTVRELTAAPTTAVPTATPGPDMFCSTYNDPHVKHFDGSVADNMNRGHFLFYKTEVLEVQARHGVYLSLDPANRNYDSVSTNNAFALTGSWVCGALVEVEAFDNGDRWSKKGKGSLRIVKDGVQHQWDTALEIQGAKAKINELICGGFDFDLTYRRNQLGPIFIIQKSGRNYQWQVRPHGINLWIMFAEGLYLTTDSGMCTKRGDYDRPLECADIIFQNFPDGHTCAEEKKKDRAIPPPRKPECDAELERAATKICGACPDEVEPEACVVETCLLGAIEFAKEQVVACAMKPPAKDNACGQRGAIRGKGESIKVARLGSACACRAACAEAGGQEWSFKAKRGKCRCYSGSASVHLKQGDVARIKRLVVGLLEGSAVTTTEV